MAGLSLPVRRVVLTALVAFSYTPVLLAATYEWTGGAIPPNPPLNGFFDTSFGWNKLSGSGTAPPGPGDLIDFNSPFPYTVQLRKNESTGFLTQRAGIVSLTGQSGVPYTLALSGSSGFGGNGIFNVSGVHLDYDFLSVGISSSQSGRLNVTGANGELNATGSTSVGAFGAGFLFVSGDATANLDNLNVGVSSSNSSGLVSAAAGGTINARNVNVATNSSTATGSLGVRNAGSSIVQSGPAASLNIGSASGGTGVVEVDANGSYTTGIGPTTVNATGTIRVGGAGSLSGGTFNGGVAGGGPINVMGTIEVNGGGVFNANVPMNFSGESKLIVDGGLMVVNQGLVQANSGSFASGFDLIDGTLRFVGGISVLDTESSGTVMGLNTIGANPRLELNSAAHLELQEVQTESPGSLIIQGVSDLSNPGSAAVIVEGGSVLSMDSAYVSQNGELRISGTDGSGGPSKLLAPSGVSSGTFYSTLSIENGGQAVTGDVRILDGFVTLSGAGSEWHVNGFFATDSQQDARTRVFNGAVLTVDGDFVVGSNISGVDENGDFELDDATLNLHGAPAPGGGRFNFVSGVINSSHPQQNLVVGIETYSGINYERVTLGGIAFGTLFDTEFVLSAGKTMNLAGFTRIDSDAELELAGGALSSARMLIQSGGTLRNSGGASTATGPVIAHAGSTINVTGGTLTIGDATAVNGFYSNGTLQVGTNAVTLLDANDAAFDSGALVTLGDSAAGGTLNAANGLTLDFGGNITGRGTIDTPNDPARPLTNNGHITGDSLANPITLTGYVKGVGTCDNCAITGTDAPGFSPAAVNRGSVSYNGVLEIEIGGTAPGSQFDQLNHILGAGIADLGGVLDVSLLGSFMPSLGDSFEIITATGGVQDVFVTEQLPSLTGGLAFDVIYDPNRVLLSVIAAGIPGDYNNNGTVDAADYSVWRDAVGAPAGTLLNDPNTGVIGTAQYTTWKNNFGTTTASIVTSPVPEPATNVMLLLAGVFAASTYDRCRKTGGP